MFIPQRQFHYEGPVNGIVKTSSIKKKPGYVIISPVRDEESFIRLTLDSVVSQSCKPSQWIIVNDASTDTTAAIVSRYQDKYPWIRLVNLNEKGQRQRGARVIHVFNMGYQLISADYDFLVKLDGDLSFGADYFDRLISKFNEDSQLGIASGEPYYPHGKRWKPEKAPLDSTRGQTKVYRKACYEDIGGLPAVLGWDTIDEIRAQMRGWKTRTFPELPLKHHRPMGSAEGFLKGIAKKGEVAYFLGYPWLVIFARSLYRCITDDPPVLAGLSIFWGYFQSWISRKSKFDDIELVSFLRSKQLKRLAFWR